MFQFVFDGSEWTLNLIVFGHSAQICILVIAKMHWLLQVRDYFTPFWRLTTRHDKQMATTVLYRLSADSISRLESLCA